MEDTKIEALFNIANEGHKTILEFKKGISNVTMYDPGANHTGFHKSSISKIDGANGTLFYRGVPIEEKIIKPDFAEVAFELIATQNTSLKDFRKGANQYFVLLPGLKRILDQLPLGIHPMNFIGVGMTALEAIAADQNLEINSDDKQDQFIISQLFVMAAYHLIKQQGGTWKDDQIKDGLSLNFLAQISTPDSNVQKFAELLEIILILHAEHGQNCSTATVRAIASAGGDLYTAISSGIFAFKGKLHGGASQNVSEMFEEILKDGISIENYVSEKLKNKEVIYGLGHRIYRNWDPRARIMYNMLNDVKNDYASVNNIKTIANSLVEHITGQQYFMDRKIYPNPDLFNNIFYQLLGIPHDMNTVMLSLSRVVGWIAHFRESQKDKSPILRPQEIYK